jgi:hypothetical protein
MGPFLKSRGKFQVRASGLVLLLFLTAATSLAQDSGGAVYTKDGEAILPPHPEYFLSTEEGIVVVQLPRGWVFDQTKKGLPFYFVKRGGNYSNARTFMYINVELLQVPFGQAVQNDAQSFQKNCPEAQITSQKPAQLLQQGCEVKTQMFICGRKRNPYVDLVTKVTAGSSLLNVVLSADTATEISRYRADYEFLLKHFTMLYTK